MNLQRQPGDAPWQYSAERPGDSLWGMLCVVVIMAPICACELPAKDAERGRLDSCGEGTQVCPAQQK